MVEGNMKTKITIVCVGALVAMFFSGIIFADETGDVIENLAYDPQGHVVEQRVTSYAADGTFLDMQMIKNTVLDASGNPLKQ